MKSVFLAIFILTGIVAYGQKKSFVSAAPYPVEVIQPDGTKLKIQGVGDEFNHFPVTEDGYTLLKNMEGFYEFAVKTKTGNLGFSGFRATNPAERSDSARYFLQGISKFQKPLVSETSVKSSVTEESPEKAFPNSGTQKVLLLMIKYPDLPSTYSKTSFNNLMNQSNYNGTGSFKDYYFQASNGQLNLSVDVYGWFLAQNNYAYYGEDNGDDRARALVAEAIDSAEAAGVDFSLYDNDNDGIVDNLMVVHSGPGAEEGSRTQYIWSHSWSLGPHYRRNYDGVRIDPYLIQPETRNYGMVNIGVFCHEFGHALGLPDLYDTDTSNGDSEGLGNWCLMASGSWLNQEKSPAMLSAWTRNKLGWISPVTISANGNYSLSPAATGTQSYKLTTPNSNEYFLLENRYKTGFDASLPGSGLAIFHINTNKTNNNDENNKLVDLEEADGRTDLDNNSNRGDAGDVFPGTSNNTSFNDNTTPNAKTYNSLLTGIDINTIYLSGSTLHFTLGGSVEQGKDLTYVSASNNLLVNSTSINVNSEIKNTGTLNAGSFNVAYYLSADATVTTSDYLVDTKPVSSLNAGSSVSLSLTKDVLTVNPQIPDGNYYVGYIIDYQNSVAELDESNNKFVFTGQLVTVSTKPNLTFNPLANIFSINGYNVSVSLTAENNGTVASDASYVGFYLSNNTILNTSDYLIGTVRLAALVPGETAQKSFSINVLDEIPDLPEGNYYLGYIIDYENVVNEYSETDNSYIYTGKTVEHILYPNLTFSAGENHLEILTSKINFSLKVLNNGEKQSNSCRVGYYLSKDAVVTSGDYLMGYSSVGQLAVNGSATLNYSADITSFGNNIDEGMYYIGYIIDYLNVVSELNENDNSFEFTDVNFHYCPPDVTLLSYVICEGDTVTYKGTKYTETGNYEFVYSSQRGCDSVIVLNLTVNPTHNIELYEVICNSESYRMGQTDYTKTGIYTQTFSNQYGCDSVVTLHLNVTDPVITVINETICEGESIAVAGINYFQTGTYLHQLNSAAGCDSTVILHLTVNQPSDTLLVKTICEGDSIVIGTRAFKTTGLFTEILANKVGCDSLVTLDLTVNPSYITIYEDMICEGDTSWLGGVPYYETGDYIHSFSTKLGCDSTIVFKLTVNPVYDTLLSITLCEGESFQVGNSVYSKTGIYVENLVSRFGCDSIVTLDLIVNPIHETVLDEIICEGDSVVVGTSVYKLPGNYVDVLSTQFGCDSTVYLTLTVNPVDKLEIFEEICAGTTYILGGISYSASGIYEHNLSNQYGCDSVVTLHLNVLPLPVVNLGNDMTVFSSEVLSLNAGPGFAGYLWNTGDTSPEISISKAQGFGPKTYSVTVTNEHSCSSSDKIVVTYYNDIKAEIGKEPVLKLFPNPGNGIVNLLIEEITGAYTVQVIAENGAMVFQDEYYSQGEKFIQTLALSHLQNGYYTVRIISEKNTMAGRLIIVKN